MADLSLKDFGPADDDRKKFRQSFFGSMLGQAAVLVGLLIFYFGGLAALVTLVAAPLKQLREWFERDLGPAWGLGLFYAVLAAPFVLVLLFSALPLALRLRSEARVKAKAFEAIPEPPASSFRLTPYGQTDRDEYRRLDGQEHKVLAWLRDTPGSIFYLSGDSGVGKSSLVAACLVPRLADDGWAVLETRAYGDAMQRLSGALRARSDLFSRAPDAGASVRDLLGTIGDRRRKAGRKPFLVIVDQFEEVLILADGRGPIPSVSSSRTWRPTRWTGSSCSLSIDPIMKPR